ncbi:hypothetical protein SAMN05444156_0452 [Verrucomicrobium sp. GAS474]|uniref:outer membrane protein assembly factor BamE domain-containing protein n=1 Tax=Verrucomicrobium sp. GAS474 TaxID=1882831 RepID=UPI00087BAE48|nr:outer membrane protein assembly factor BamE [Verrucomicrobium sp. GAS474]SDT88865.1 hypothetical protein SAMN05444156_0452 [Verrucomicrobium sp. GAS474]
MKNLLKLSLCLLAVLPLAACDQPPGKAATSIFGTSLTQANLDRVQTDMSPAMVKSILGEPSESKTEAIPIVGGTQTTYIYRNNSSEVKIVFKNDQMKEKTGSFGS